MACRYEALGFVAALALLPMAASAATVDITFQSFGNTASGSSPNKSAAITALDDFIGSSPIIGAEDFEEFAKCPANVCASANSTKDTRKDNRYAIADCLGLIV